MSKPTCQQPGCDRPLYSLGWCGLHYTRDRRGMDMARPHQQEITVADRLWSKIAVGGPDECWEWQAYRLPAGYGTIDVSGRKSTATRVVWEVTYGPIPDGLLVCHRCDNPPCCNPSHLFLGTPAENTADMVSKGRARSGGRKLTEDDVQAIRNDPRSHEAVAAEFGVSPSNVCMIRSGKTWKHT